MADTEYVNVWDPQSHVMRSLPRGQVEIIDQPSNAQTWTGVRERLDFAMVQGEVYLMEHIYFKYFAPNGSIKPAHGNHTYGGCGHPETCPTCQLTNKEATEYPFPGY